MKAFLIIIFVLLLSGCSTVPAKRNFPEIPVELSTPCPTLLITESTTKLSDVVSIVTKNYEQYHECQIKSETWIDWYNSQKQIFESVK